MEAVLWAVAVLVLINVMIAIALVVRYKREEKEP